MHFVDSRKIAHTAKDHFSRKNVYRFTHLQQTCFVMNLDIYTHFLVLIPFYIYIYIYINLYCMLHLMGMVGIQITDYTLHWRTIQLCLIDHIEDTIN